MFHFNDDTIAYFKDLAKQHGVDSEEYTKEARRFITLDYALEDGETVDSALYALNEFVNNEL